MRSGWKGSLVTNRYQLGFVAVALFVLLRVAIGWHFLYEGLWKRANPDFSAATFLRQAKGPLAEQFYALVPDIDNHERLDAERVEAAWDAYRRQAAGYYGFDETQQRQAERVINLRKAQLREWFADNKTELERHFDDWRQLRNRTAGTSVLAAPYQQKRTWDKQQQLRSEAGAWNAQILAVERGFEQDLAELATAEQLAQGAPPAAASSLARLDKTMTYGLIAIGFCLMVGLFTRFACLAGALFLLGVVLAQPAWPLIYPPAPAPAGHSLIVNKELIEMLALLALATTAVGKWAGLDFFINQWITRPLFRRRGT